MKRKEKKKLKIKKKEKRDNKKEYIYKKSFCDFLRLSTLSGVFCVFLGFMVGCEGTVIFGYIADFMFIS